jgi:integrase/recombinase XerD
MTEAQFAYRARPIALQADTDERLIALWLHGRAATAQPAYCLDAERFLIFVRKPLRQVAV